MLTINGNYQYIDWSHSPVNPEPYEHFGTLETFIINPGITIGLTEYLNFEYNQVLGVRSMHFGPDEKSIHHDTETSLTDYENDNDFNQYDSEDINQLTPGKKRLIENQKNKSDYEWDINQDKKIFHFAVIFMNYC